MFHVEHPLTFSATCSANGLYLTLQQVALFEKYALLLREWNAKVNLVSRKDEQNLWGSHFLHSVAPLFALEVPDILKVLDMGTGGGLPGIPLAIAKSGWSVTLLDSIGKKTVAIQDIVQRLGLGKVEVVNGRAEDAAIAGSRRGKYHLVVARGVASMAQLAKWSRPYLVKRTTPVADSASTLLPVPSLVAFKGGDIEDELKELRMKAPGTVHYVKDLSFPGSLQAGLEGKKLVVLQFT